MFRYDGIVRYVFAPRAFNLNIPHIFVCATGSSELEGGRLEPGTGVESQGGMRMRKAKK